MVTKQVEFWKSDFGYEYSLRGENVLSKDNLKRLHRDWGKILSKANNPYPNSVLEVGCNIGRNLMCLKNFINELHAVEPNSKACQAIRNNEKLSRVSLTETDGFNLPYSDNSIDLVFTSGVLIHVSPEDLKKIVKEIHRVAKHYIVCIEYFSHEPQEVKYHNKDGFLFKRDFGGFYLDCFSDIKVVDYGFLWQRYDSSDDSNWWLFSKT